MPLRSIVRLLASGILGPALLVGSAEGELNHRPADSPLLAVMAIDGGALIGTGPGGFTLSHDGGRTWMPLQKPSTFARDEAFGLQRTKNGVLVLVAKEVQRAGTARLRSARSLDDGRTWSEPRVIPDSGGVLECLTATSAGLILVTADHPTVEFTVLRVRISRHDGLEWTALGSIKLPAGVRAPYSNIRYGTAVSDQPGGVLRLLTTTDAGCLWEASWRPGRDRWTGIMPAPVAAGPGPIALARLASGRLAMAWMRPTSIGLPARWLALSHNDGVTWTVPTVQRELQGLAAVESAGEFGLGEIKPGVLRLTDGRTAMELKEMDYLQSRSIAHNRRRVRVLMMGDSITRGARPGVTFSAVYSELARTGLRAAAPDIDVHNVGIGAERTDQALARLDGDVLSQVPAIVTLMYGTNDSYVDARKSTSRLTRTEYRRNLETLVARIREAGAVPILMTPPRWGAAAKPNGAGENPNVALTGYVEECRSVARALDVPIVDHHRRWSEAEKEGVDVGVWTTDQCHPNARGHEQLATELLPVLRRVLARVQASQH